MANSTLILVSVTPGLLVTVILLYLANREGGIMFMAVAGAVLIPCLLAACGLNMLLWRRYFTKKIISAALAGFLLYVVIAGGIVLLLNRFGPSQIM